MSMWHFQDLHALQSLALSPVQFDDKGVRFCIVDLTNMASTRQSKNCLHDTYLDYEKNLLNTRGNYLPKLRSTL